MPKLIYTWKPDKTRITTTEKKLVAKILTRGGWELADWYQDEQPGWESVMEHTPMSVCIVMLDSWWHVWDVCAPVPIGKHKTGLNTLNGFHMSWVVINSTSQENTLQSGVNDGQLQHTTFVVPSNLYIDIYIYIYKYIYI